MSLATDVEVSGRGGRGPVLVRRFRMATGAMAVLVVWEATMAGQVLSGNGAALRFHEAGSYTLFATAVVTAAIAAVAWRRGALNGALAAGGGIVVPVLVTLQAWAGYARWLHLHVPLGVSLLGLALGLLALTPRAAGHSSLHRR